MQLEFATYAKINQNTSQNDHRSYEKGRALGKT